MKFFKWEISTSRVSFVHTWFRVSQFIRDLPYWLLIRHARIVGVILFGVVLILGIWLVVTLLYLQPADSDFLIKKQLQLAIKHIDDLEFWIEFRNGERTGELQHVRNDIFVSVEQ